MRLKVVRKVKTDTYTLGNLFVEDTYFCDTLEDKDRGLDDSMSLEEIKSKKVYGRTAIPKGTYEITLDVVSPKFSTYSFYKEICKGKVPRLLNVKGFEGILIHVADGYKGAELVQGCIGIGLNKIKGGLLEGKETFKKLYQLLQDSKNKGEKLTIKIE